MLIQINEIVCETKNLLSARFFSFYFSLLPLQIMPFLLLLSALLAGCTIYGSIFGIEMAHAHIYDALWFNTLWGIVLIYSCVECIRRRAWRHPIIAPQALASLSLSQFFGYSANFTISGVRNRELKA